MKFKSFCFSSDLNANQMSNEINSFLDKEKIRLTEVTIGSLGEDCITVGLIHQPSDMKLNYQVQISAFPQGEENQIDHKVNEFIDGRNVEFLESCNCWGIWMVLIATTS